MLPINDRGKRFLRDAYAQMHRIHSDHPLRLREALRSGDPKRVHALLKCFPDLWERFCELLDESREG